MGAGVIGTPIRHSLSPAIFNSAFVALDLDWVYLAFEVASGDAPAAVQGARALGLAGLSVTMPHKEAVIPALDALSDDAAALGAVNCIAIGPDGTRGLNTDGVGLVDALRVENGIEITGRRCVVIGAGGAGRSVARALGAAGAADVAIVNRTAAKAAAAAELAGRVGRVGEASSVATADLIVNATPIGMGGAAPGSPVAAEGLRSDQVVVDLVYHPATTQLLADATAAGATAVNGLGMLVHQAGHAFQAWTGIEAPIAEMRAGALAALAARSGA